MDANLNTPLNSEAEIVIVGQTTQGLELQANVVRLSRFSVVFEAYHPSLVLRTSEILDPVKITINGRPAYKGRAVMTNFVSGGPVLLCEASLEEGWFDVGLFTVQTDAAKLRADFEHFMGASQKAFRIRPDFKLAVADMQTVLLTIRSWCEQLELSIHSQPAGDRVKSERDILDALRDSALTKLHSYFGEFEEVCKKVEQDARAAHSSYVKRQLHPIVLCSPFMYRIFRKPLGYAGDYEMVNMMARDPYEGGSLFAKLLNTYLLDTAPVIAHRNRLDYLANMLKNEALRAERNGRVARIYNLGCGPSKEIQDFLRDSELSELTDFTLLDFNDETLQYAGRVLNEIKANCHRKTPIQLLKKSVAQVLKDSIKARSAGPSYDLVYCAGLFDYLPDPVCQRLTSLFYEMVKPGGLLVVTNVEPSNFSRAWQEYGIEWYLIYRTAKDLARLVPPQAAPDTWRVQAEASGVNLFLEIRKPENG